MSQQQPESGPKVGNSSQPGASEVRRPEVTDGQRMPAPDLGSAVDRVERHELQRRLQRLSVEMDRMRKVLGSLTRFRTVIDRAGEAIFIIDPTSGRFVDVNETALKWLGLPRDRLLSLSVSDVDVQFPLEYTERDVDHVTETRSAERPQLYGEGIHRRRDGTWFPVEVAIARRRFADRDLVLVVARESTARRQAEQELSESEERYRTLFELTRDAIYLTRRDGTVVDVNAAAVSLFGYSREELVGLQARKLYSDKRHIRAFQEGVEENGFVRELPVTLCRKDGQTFTAFLTACLRHTGDGVIDGYQCLIRLVPVAELPITEVAEGQQDSQIVEDIIAEVASASTSFEAEAVDPIDQSPSDEIDELAGDIDQPGESEPAVDVGTVSVQRERIFHPAVEIDSPPAHVRTSDADGSGAAQGFGTRAGTVRRTRRGEVQQLRRAPWESKPPVPAAGVRAVGRGMWPAVLGVGVGVSVFAWSSMIASSYPYDTGLQVWQLCVRGWGVILVSLGVAGRESKRVVRVVAVGLAVTAVAVVMAFVLYLLRAPFGLQSIVPNSAGALNLRVLSASQFVAAVILCTAPLSWFLWRSARPKTIR